MTDINWPLMTETLDHIHKNPRLWNQGLWACGTQRCIAGHAAELSGKIPADHVVASGGMILEPRWLHRIGEGLYPSGEAHVAIDSGELKRLHVAEVAREALGLPDEELFNGEYTWEDVMATVSEWAAEDGIDLPKEWFA